jgi:4'-phosphopantetheinyl transferase
MMTPRLFEEANGLAPRAPLGEAEIHVWCIPLEIEADALTGLGRLLCADEQARARRFRFEPDRQRYVAARAALRILLGRYVDSPPERIVFSYSTSGKPFLAPPGGGRGPYFNISHSGQIALMAFCASAQLGIDVELVREIADTENIVRGFFCREEIEHWMELPADLRKRAFYDCWTRKEAFVKASGDGLSMPLDGFQVSFGPGAVPSIRVPQYADEPRWCLFDVSPASDYSGALAIAGIRWDLHCWICSNAWNEL